MEKNKKVLIVGASARDYSLAKKFKSYGCEVVVAPGNTAISEIVECLDIREDNVKELLEFALENAVDLTVVSSEIALKNDISRLFQANSQLIFAPSAQSAEFTLSRSICRKFLYKLKFPSPRFAIFDKPQFAVDYLKNASMPQVIRADEYFEHGDRLVCTSFSTAKTFVEDLFCKDVKKVVLEDFVYGHECTVYVVTDGYSALHLATVANYKFLEEGDGGILTSGIGAFTPDYKISSQIQDYFMTDIINNILLALQKKGTPYLGILGADCVLQDDGNFVVLDFKPFLADHDSEAILNLVDENLYDLFEACAIGAFADDYTCLNVSDNASVSCVMSSRSEGKVIKGLELVDSDITYFALKKNKYLEYETILGRNLVLTRTAKTLSRARKFLYEDAELIDFEGKKYRSDICRQVENF